MSLEVSALRAIAHPIRLQILSLLTGAEMSAAEVARELDITQANASYHLRTLLAVGMVEEAGQEVVRGGKAKRYRPAPDTKLPGGPGEARIYVEAIAGELIRRSALRAAEARGVSADADLWVEPAVWDDVCERVHEAMKFLHESARPPRSPGTVRTSATVVLFRMEEAR
jgi:DNA-binding transcriptional ArsR family regulator